MENNRRPTLEQVLGKQTIDLLHVAGIRNLRVENDGSISGEQDTVRGLPQVDHIKNLAIKKKEDRIVIDGEIIESITDAGKVI